MTKQEREDNFIRELKELSAKYGVTVEPYMALRATAMPDASQVPESAAQKVEQALADEPKV